MFGWGEDSPDTDDDDILATEFLLKLADEALLDLVEGLEEAVWDVDEDGFSGGGNVRSQWRLRCRDRGGRFLARR